MRTTIGELARVPLLRSVFLVNFILSLHYFLVVYINSSFVNTFYSKDTTSLLFTVGSVGALILFWLAPLIIKKEGLHSFFIASLLIEALAIGGLIFGKSVLGVGIFFLTHLVISPFVFYCLDIFLEHGWHKEGGTGVLRGVYLTLTNIALLGSPLLLGTILQDSDRYRDVYLISLILIFPALLLSWKRLKERFHSVIHIVRRETIKHALFKHNNISYAITARFILQFFYAWMTIYTPIYLYTVIGFDWKEIGLIFTIMLIPFSIFELPVAEAADRWWGEKELMTIGFVIMAAATFWLPFLKANTILIWSLALFATRIGASIVEITTESYFFKQVKEADADFISLFRMTWPLSFIFAPLVATFIFKGLSFTSSFFFLAVVVALGTTASLSIRDTK